MSPVLTAWRARNSADEPLAHALVTVMIGTPVWPDGVETALRKWTETG